MTKTAITKLETSAAIMPIWHRRPRAPEVVRKSGHYSSEYRPAEQGALVCESLEAAIASCRPGTGRGSSARPRACAMPWDPIS